VKRLRRVVSSFEVWFEYRDPSNATYRATSEGSTTVQQELDPTGADQGVTDPVTQSIPDEGLLSPYPNTFNPSQPFAAYSLDGIRASLDEFVEQVRFQFHGELGLNEAIARSSRYPRPNPAPPCGERRNGRTRVLAIEKLFFSVLNQKTGGFSRRPIDGGAGFGSAKGVMKPNGKGNARVYLPAHGELQNWHDAQTALAELMHLAGKKSYSDYELAIVVSKIPEYAKEFNGPPEQHL
jgi:hypothetical protein